MFSCVCEYMYLSPAQICLISANVLWKKHPSLCLGDLLLYFFYSGSFSTASTTVQPYVKDRMNTEQWFEKIQRFTNNYTVRKKQFPESKDHSPLKLIL